MKSIHTASEIPREGRKWRLSACTGSLKEALATCPNHLRRGHYRCEVLVVVGGALCPETKNAVFPPLWMCGPHCVDAGRAAEVYSRRTPRFVAYKLGLVRERAKE